MKIAFNETKVLQRVLQEALQTALLKIKRQTSWLDEEIAEERVSDFATFLLKVIEPEVLQWLEPTIGTGTHPVAVTVVPPPPE